MFRRNQTDKFTVNCTPKEGFLVQSMNVFLVLLFEFYLPSADVRLGGLPGGGRGTNWAARSPWTEERLTGLGILLLCECGLEEEENEGASSPCLSPCVDSSSCERSEAEVEDRRSRWTEESEGEAHGEAQGEVGRRWPRFCSSFSLAEPGGASCSKLEGSRTGMRLSRWLGSRQGTAVGEDWTWSVLSTEDVTLLFNGGCWSCSGEASQSLLVSCSHSSVFWASAAESAWLFIKTGLQVLWVKFSGLGTGLGVCGFPFLFIRISASALVGLEHRDRGCSWGEWMSTVRSWGCASFLQVSWFSSSGHCGMLSEADWEERAEGRWAVN